MVEMLLSAVPFGDVKHTGDTILRASKQLLAGYGVGQYECSFTASGTEIVLLDTVLQSVHRLVRISSSQVVYLHAIGPKVQEVQLLANTQVR